MNAPSETPLRLQLVALDLDGTLLNDAGEISPCDATALRGFARSGGTVVLASGRMTANIRPFYEALGIDGPTIAYNGALAREHQEAGGEVILEAPLAARYGDELIDYTRRERLHLNYYLGERLYALDDPALRRHADLYSRQTGAVFDFVSDLDRFKGSAPTKALIVTDPSVPGNSDPHRRDELYALWHAKWGSEITVMRTNPEYLEFYSRDASKGSALAAVAARCGVERPLTLAIGDNFNDVSMLSWAGCGVAVANAQPQAKEAADWVSPLSNNESAVADAIRRFALGAL
jgi:Cof subfamily protein (haloacid dehalogenase superfamily)